MNLKERQEVVNREHSEAVELLYKAAERIQQEECEATKDASAKNAITRKTCPHCDEFDNKTIKFRNVTGEVNGNGSWGLFGGSMEIKGETRTGEVYCCKKCQNEWIPGDRDIEIERCRDPYRVAGQCLVSMVFYMKDKEHAASRLRSHKHEELLPILEYHAETLLHLHNEMQYFLFTQNESKPISALEEKGYKALKHDTLWETIKRKFS